MAASRPELAAHAEALQLSFPELVAKLRRLLGAQLVAYLASVRQTKAITAWSGGRQEADDNTKRRLHEAYVVARMLADVETSAVVQACFQGLNPALDDRSPARLLREGDLDEVGPQVLGAARAFLAHGS